MAKPCLELGLESLGGPASRTMCCWSSAHSFLAPACAAGWGRAGWSQKASTHVTGGPMGCSLSEHQRNPRCSAVLVLWNPCQTTFRGESLAGEPGRWSWELSTAYWASVLLTRLALAQHPGAWNSSPTAVQLVMQGVPSSLQVVAWEGNAANTPLFLSRWAQETGADLWARNSSSGSFLVSLKMWPFRPHGHLWPWTTWTPHSGLHTKALEMN